MKKLADFICRHKVLVLIITGILFILSIIGYKLTGINYDILVYLPKEIETVKGQNILTNEFNMGAYSVVVTKSLSAKELLNLQEEYQKIEGVNKVLSIYDVIGESFPIEMLPSDIASHLHDKDTDILFVTFTDGTSSESTINAIRAMRKISSKKALISGMSSMVVDTMELSEKEIAIYVVIAVILCLIVLELFLDSYVAPIILLANIGISIIFNLGSNIIFGEISYITKALVAVLQLGVTMDFSIFLYHAYESAKEKNNDNESAIKEAILKTCKSVTGSSITTIVGFLALCAMDLTLGMDLGLVMAKGVLIGVICVLTVFPSMLLFFDKLIEKTKHKSLKLNMTWLNKSIIKHHKIIFAIFIILIIPFYLANSKVSVYYKIDRSLPDTLESISANKELNEKFNIVSPEILLIPNSLKLSEETNLINDIKKVPGIDLVISSASLSEYGLTNNILPSSLQESLESANYRLVLINSLYEVASDELNNQVDEINLLVSKYDKDIILAGEGALTKDLVSISDNDFKHVNFFSIFLVIIVMLIVLKSISLPILLVITIEFAIFVNMGISYFSGTILPFVAPIVLGTIQLGATIDYAILLTTNYLTNRQTMNKEEAMLEASNYCVPSIIVSGLCFFAATFGVGIYSKLEMVGSLCTLISRGAIISMFVVILILPSVLLIMDKLIKITTLKEKEGQNMKNKTIKTLKKATVLTLITSLLLEPMSVLALSKEETVYSKLSPTGEASTIIVNNYLKNPNHTNELEDFTDLKDIVNLSGNETFEYHNNELLWQANGNNILYQGTTTKNLPVTETISYKLNNKDITITDLLGKSGHIEITIKYKNNDLHNVNINGNSESLYTPFLVTTALSLPHDNTDVTITNGKVIDTGNKYLVASLSTPGLYESLAIDELANLDEVILSFNTESFELPAIYTIVTPKLIDSEDLKIFSKMEEMYGSIDELQRNMDTLENSAKVISSNMNTVNENTTLLYNTLNTVLTSVNDLEKGTTSLDTGLKTLLSNLENAKKSLNNEETITKINTMKTLYETDAAQIQNITKQNTALKTKYNELNLANITYEQILATNNMDLYNLKYTYENFYESNNQLVSLLTYNMKALESSIKAFQDISENINTMITTVSTYMTELSNGATKINTGVKSLNSGLNKITSSVGTLNAGTQKLSAGTTEFTNGMTRFNDEGINKLTNIKNKMRKLTTKAKKLTELADNYKTFTLSNKSITDGETKFIYVIDSIKVKDETPKANKVEEKETIWDRIKNLFK